MASGVDDILRFAGFTLRNPRAAARWILNLRLDPSTGWAALALACVLASILFHLSIALLGPVEQDLAGVFGGPVGTVAISGTALLILVFGVHLVGRAFGGKGELAGAVVLIAWIQAIFLILQVIQVLFLITIPVVADIIGTFGLVLFLWLLAPFVTELHGFSSVWKVLFGIIGTVFAIALALSFLILLAAGT